MLLCCGGLGIGGKSLKGGGAGKPAWLYILNSAKRVISNADKGPPGGGGAPGGLCLPENDDNER